MQHCTLHRVGCPDSDQIYVGFREAARCRALFPPLIALFSWFLTMCEVSSGWACPVLAVSVLSNLVCSDACSLLLKTQNLIWFRKLGEVFMFFTTIKFQIRDESLNKSVLFVCLCSRIVHTSL